MRGGESVPSGGLEAATSFLTAQTVLQTPLSSRIKYLESKGFSEQEIATALRIADNVFRNEGMIPREEKVVATAEPSQVGRVLGAIGHHVGAARGGGGGSSWAMRGATAANPPCAGEGGGGVGRAGGGGGARRGGGSALASSSGGHPHHGAMGGGAGGAQTVEYYGQYKRHVLPLAQQQLLQRQLQQLEQQQQQQLLQQQQQQQQQCNVGCRSSPPSPGVLLWPEEISPVISHASPITISPALSQASPILLTRSLPPGLAATAAGPPGGGGSVGSSPANYSPGGSHDYYTQLLAQQWQKHQKSTYKPPPHNHHTRQIPPCSSRGIPMPHTKQYNGNPQRDAGRPHYHNMHAKHQQQHSSKGQQTYYQPSSPEQHHQQFFNQQQQQKQQQQIPPGPPPMAGNLVAWKENSNAGLPPSSPASCNIYPNPIYHSHSQNDLLVDRGLGGHHHLPSSASMGGGLQGLSGMLESLEDVEGDFDGLRNGAFPRHARRREAKRQRKAAATLQAQMDGVDIKVEEDDALPWHKTIASGRVQKHLMRFLNNFISQKDLEDELGLHMADVFYENETGPTMLALYEKLEKRVAERCPDRVAEFREEALASLASLMAACEEREEQQEKGREALKNSGQRGKPVRNAAKRLGKSRTEARKLGAMIAYYRALPLTIDDSTGVIDEGKGSPGFVDYSSPFMSNASLSPPPVESFRKGVHTSSGSSVCSTSSSNSISSLGSSSLLLDAASLLPTLAKTSGSTMSPIDGGGYMVEKQD